MYIGHELSDGRHMTLTFNMHDETQADFNNAVMATKHALQHWVAWEGTKFAMKFGKLDRFVPSGAWHTKIITPSLSKFRDEYLVPELKLWQVPYSDDFKFVPHVTITYYKKPKVNPYPEGEEQVVSHLSVFSNPFGAVVFDV